MNISKPDSDLSIRPWYEARANKASKVKQEARIEIPDDILDINATRATTNSVKDLNKLSPLNQYRFFDGQEPIEDKVKLRVIPGNPQKTLSLANKAINQAIMPPAFSNPDRQQLQQAIQLKHLARGMLDKAA